MKEYIKRILGVKSSIKPSDAVYSFLTNTTSKEKKRVLTEIVRKSNEDQKALDDRYGKIVRCENR